VIDDVADCLAYKAMPTVTWVNVDGVHDVHVLERLGGHYGLHALTIEDIVNTHQRLKLEVFEEYIFLVVKMHSYVQETHEMLIEQVSIVLGDNFVLTFQEQEGDVFEMIRTRLRSNKGQLRKGGADYLIYALLDALVDSYFEVLEMFGEDIEEIEEALMQAPQKQALQELHGLKRELLFLRKSAWPLRNMFGELERQKTALLSDDTLVYLRDLYDHSLQVIETIEIFREMVSSNLDLYLSSLSNKMNEVMQFLTIVNTIFIPLTFIAGVYGMNFENMPELATKWGYFAILGLMASIATGLLLYFKKKNWL